MPAPLRKPAHEVILDYVEERIDFLLNIDIKSTSIRASLECEFTGTIQVLLNILGAIIISKKEAPEVLQRLRVLNKRLLKSSLYDSDYSVIKKIIAQVSRNISIL